MSVLLKCNKMFYNMFFEYFSLNVTKMLQNASE